MKYFQFNQVLITCIWLNLKRCSEQQVCCLSLLFLRSIMENQFIHLIFWAHKFYFNWNKKSLNINENYLSHTLCMLLTLDPIFKRDMWRRRWAVFKKTKKNKHIHKSIEEKTPNMYYSIIKMNQLNVQRKATDRPTAAAWQSTSNNNQSIVNICRSQLQLLRSVANAHKIKYNNKRNNNNGKNCNNNKNNK